MYTSLTWNDSSSLCFTRDSASGRCCGCSCCVVTNTAACACRSSSTTRASAAHPLLQQHANSSSSRSSACHAACRISGPAAVRRVNVTAAAAALLLCDIACAAAPRAHAAAAAVGAASLDAKAKASPSPATCHGRRRRRRCCCYCCLHGTRAASAPCRTSTTSAPPTPAMPLCPAGNAAAAAVVPASHTTPCTCAAWPMRPCVPLRASVCLCLCLCVCVTLTWCVCRSCTTLRLFRSRRFDVGACACCCRWWLCLLFHWNALLLPPWGGGLSLTVGAWDDAPADDARWDTLALALSQPCVWASFVCMHAVCGFAIHAHGCTCVGTPCGHKFGAPSAKACSSPTARNPTPPQH